MAKYPHQAAEELWFTLNESAEVLGMIEVKEATCGNVNEMMNKKVQLLDTKIMDMVALRNQLINGLRNVMTAVILPAQKKTARS